MKKKQIKKYSAQSVDSGHTIRHISNHGTNNNGDTIYQGENMNFETFLLCVDISARVICGNDIVCQDEITECMTDGESVNFCAMEQNKIADINMKCRYLLLSDYPELI